MRSLKLLIRSYKIYQIFCVYDAELAFELLRLIIKAGGTVSWPDERHETVS